MSDKDLHILQHSLGVDQYGRGRRYRNHFCTSPDGDDFAACGRLVARGLMNDHGPSELAGGMHTFTVTIYGHKYVSEESPAPPKITRSQQRYVDYLNAECGETFGDWLKRTTRRFHA